MYGVILVDIEINVHEILQIFQWPSLGENSDN